MATMKRLETDPQFSIDSIEISHADITVQVERDTGNWHPEGRAWHASIRADVTHFVEPAGWAAGVAAHGSSSADAIQRAYNFAASRTLRFPAGWLDTVLAALEQETA